MADYKKKKGASGKKYTTLGEQILVTYTDGSTRRVKPGDDTYNATKEAMQKDIKAKKFWKPAGNSKTTAETAVGKGVTDGIITTAEKNKLAEQAQAAAKQRKQAQAVRKVADGRSKQPATEQAKVLNNAINTMIAKKAVDTVKSAPKVVKSGVEHGVHNTIAGTKQGAVSGMSNLGRGGMAEAMPYMAVAEKLGAVKPGTHTDLMQQQKDGMEALQRVIAENTRRKGQQISDKYGPMSNGEQFISDFIAGLIPMGAAVAGGAIAGPAGAIAPMYNYAKGASVTQALNDGADYDEAQAYGIGKGAVDTGASMIFKGMAGLPGKFKAGEKVAGMVTNPALKKAGSAIADVASEGAEEALAEIIDPLLQRATYNEDAKLDWNRVLESAIMGSLTAGAFNAGAAGLRNLPKIAGNMQENDQQRAFDALHSQKFQPKQVESTETAQDSPEQAQSIPTTEHFNSTENGAQEQNMKADFKPKPVQNVQNRETVENTPKITLKMSERTFENVGDKNVRAYQQENPTVKPFYQRVADNLLADLQMGVKGGRDAGVDPETRTVTTMGGWQREQSEPIERMLRDGMTYNQIEDGLQRIVEDNGKENTANAKRAELYVDEAVRKGYRSVVEGDVSADRSFAYRGMTAEQLQEVYNRLENSFTGNPEQDAAIISEMETVQNILDGMGTVADNATVDEEFSEADESDRYQELIDEYGAMPKGENPFGSNRDIEVPNQTNDFDKVRRFNRTAMEAEQTADETVGIMKDKIASDYQDGSVTYEPISNPATLKDANIRINQNGWEKEAHYFSDAISKGTRITAEDIAVAERCIQEAQKAGNYEAAANIISDLSIVGTEYGQAIQALSMLKRLSPEGQLKTFLKVQERINNQLIAQGKKPVMDITPEVQAEFLAAKDTAERDAIWKREIAKAASQTSGTWREKINALRYAAMLSNPKTHIRNMIGNFVMQAAYVPRNIISGALQDIKGGEKTHSLTATFKNKTGNTGKELRDYAQYDLKEYAERALQNIGNRYDDVSGEFESQRRTFGNGIVGRGLEQVAGKGKYSVGSMLDKEDMLFKKLTYKNALIDYMRANGISVSDAKSGVTKPNGSSIAKGREYAMEQARKATFTEDNIVAEWLSEGERKLGVGGAITIGSVMPFKKNPLNILSRGVEFSPVGAGMTAYKLYHAVSGKKGLNGSYYDLNDVMDGIGANLTGTGIMALGMYLASQGLLETTSDDDDERKARYDSQMGDQNFAVVNPETGESWTIDWLAPSAMPLLTGVEVYRQLFGENEEVDVNVLNKALDSASKIADPVFEMSCMQGVASALASYSGDAGDIASSLLANVATGIAGQFIPQPMAAWARTIDDTVRSSYASKESEVLLGKTGESFARQQRSKLPYASMENEPSIDVWGNERKREFAGDEMEQVLARTFNNFFNPTTYSSNKRTELDLTLEALYKDTGDSGVLPKSATNYVTVDGTNYHKKPAEKTAYDKTKGQKSKQYVSDFVNSNVYGNLDNTTKTKIVEELYNLTNYEAKKEMLDNRQINYSDSEYENVLDSGVSPYEYYATKAVSAAAGMTGKFEDVQEKMDTCDKLKMDYSTYSELSKALSDLHDSTDANGKTIKGKSRKDKVYATLKEQRDSGVITDEQMWYIWVDSYNAKTRDKKSSLPYWKDCPYKWIVDAKVAEKEADAEAKKNRQ